MNGVHDMGGMHGFGPIVREKDEPLFHAEWEARVRAIMNLSMVDGLFNLDAFRYGIEQMAPADYLRAPYYERWITSVTRNLIHNGYLTSDELSDYIERLSGSAPSPADLDAVEQWQPVAACIEPPRTQPFSIGDAVVARNAHPVGHTRLPRYARGKRGVIETLRGSHTLPDANALGIGECPERLYKVRFEGRELWGDSAESNSVVHLDLWESYLLPAPV